MHQQCFIWINMRSDNLIKNFLLTITAFIKDINQYIYCLNFSCIMINQLYTLFIRNKNSSTFPDFNAVIIQILLPYLQR